MNRFEKLVSMLEECKLTKKELEKLKQTDFNVDKEIDAQTKLDEKEVKELDKNVINLQFELDGKKEKLENKISNMSVHELTETMAEYINKKQEELNEEQLKIDNIKKYITIKKEKLNKKVSAIKANFKANISRNNQLVSDKKKLLYKKIKETSELLPEIEKEELNQFLIKFLKEETGKNFVIFNDKTNYQQMYYSDRYEYYEDVFFEGVKCVDKPYENIEELLNGIKNKEVILTTINDRYNHKWKKDYNLLSEVLEFSYDNTIGSYYENDNNSVLPKVSLFNTTTKEINYFNIYNNLEKSLINYVENKIIEEEKNNLNDCQSYVKKIEYIINTNSDRLNKEIEQLKQKYEEDLKTNKISLATAKSNLTKQQKVVNSLVKTNIKKSASETEQDEKEVELT